MKNEPPSTVSVQIDVVYPENSLRPTGYQVKYKIVDPNNKINNIIKKYIPNEKNSVKKECKSAGFSGLMKER